MKQQQEHLNLINKITRKRTEGETYCAMWELLFDFGWKHPEIKKQLDAKMLSGEIKSLDDIGEFLFSCYEDCKRQTEELIKEL